MVFSSRGRKRERINSTRDTKPENRKSTQQKRLATISKNSGGTKSKSEDSFYHKLLLYFSEDDVIRGYSDERYPFSCDFYVKSKDIFIEYQGHYTHGNEPFDASNSEHLSYLERMSRKVNMDTWIKRDPIKLQTAKQNGITLILVYPRHNTYVVKDGKVTTLQL